MKREIKFRAWDGTQMYYKVNILPNWGAIKEGYSATPWSDDAKAGIAMQFTGLHDKNGKEIYEGDMNQDKGIVKWNNDSASFVWDYNNDLHCFEEESEWCEIIGNIYENPELLQP